MTGAVHEAEPDFLARVVDKALGVDAGIAPRMRSAFEPASQKLLMESRTRSPEATRLTALMLEYDTADERRYRPRPSDLAKPDRQSPQRDAPTGQRGAPPADETAPASAGLALSAKLQAAVPANPAAPWGSAIPDDAREPPAGARIISAHVTAAPSATVDGEKRASRLPTSTLRLVSTPALPPTRDDRSARAEEGSHAPSLSAGEGTQASLAPGPKVAVAHIFTAAPRLSLWQQQNERGGKQPEAPAAPIVNVTIGRVEVRATPAPAVPLPRIARGPQPLGLDEYLRRRNER